MFLLAADTHHDRDAGLLRQERGDYQRNVPGNFAAEPATGVFADEHDFVGLDAQPSCDRGNGLSGALSAGMNVDLTVLPVRHRCTSLEALMARVGRNECFVKNERRVFQTRIDIADRPLFARLAHRQTALFGFLEIIAGPLKCLEFGRILRWRLAGLRRRWRHSHPSVPISSGVRAARPQAYERIDHERQTLIIDFNFFNCIGGSELVDCGYGKNGLALKQRLHRQRLISPGVGQNHGSVIVDAVGRRRKLVHGENCLHSRHRERRARIYTPHSCVRHGAQEQLAEKHAVRAIVLGVLRLSSNFSVKVTSRVILANQLVLIGGRYFRHGSPSLDSPRRASSR